MPTINKRLLLKLVLATLVFGVALFLIHYVQRDRATEALRWQAERAAEHGKLDRAILYMGQYLELRPDDHDAAIRLADLILTRGQSGKQLANAMFLYERVLREAPHREGIRDKLVDLSMRLNRPADAQIHLQAILEKSPTAAGWEKLALCQAAQDRFDDAVESLGKAVALDSKQVRSYELMVEILTRHFHRDDEASGWLERMIRANPDDAGAYLVRARWLRGRERNAESLRDVERVLELRPGDPDALLLSSEIHLLRGDFAKARAALAAGTNAQPRDVRFHRSLSWLELADNNLPAGIACLERGMEQLPDAVELMAPLADLLVQQGDAAKAREILKKLESRRDAAAQVRYVRARLLMHDEKWSQAAELFETVRTDAVALPGLAAQLNWLIAFCHERLGNIDAQMDALQRVVAIDPGHLSARLRFAALHLAAGKFDAAVREHTIAARSPFAPLGVRVGLGRLLIARARQSASEDWSHVADYVETLRKKYPNTVDPVLLAAEMHLYRRQHDAARRLLRAEAGRKVNDPRIWSVLSVVELDSRGLFAALETLDEAQTLIGDAVELRLARARAWSHDPRPDRSERILAQVRGLEDLSDVRQRQLLAGLSEIAAAVGDIDGQKRMLVQLAAVALRDARVRQSALLLAMRSSDDRLADRLRAELKSLQKPGDEFDAVAELIGRLEQEQTRKGSIAAAEALAQQVLVRSADRADAHYLAALAADASGSQRKAASHFESALRPRPRQPALSGRQARVDVAIRDGLARPAGADAVRPPRFVGGLSRGVRSGDAEL